MFGRRRQVDALLLLLQKSRFLPIVGSSGCGKSSLVRAGLIPALKGGFLVRERNEWLVATITPGTSPLKNLALTLCSLAELASPAQALEDLLQAIELRGSEALAEFVRALLGTQKNLLLCVDQFEEIFALRSRIADPSEDGAEKSDAASQSTTREKDRLFAVSIKEETNEFVALMLSLASHQDLSAYVVLTMRSDFLGDCDVFPGLPEAMNETRYLVPRLTREQLRQAIEGPLKLTGRTLEPRLLDRLLNEVADRPDQLPVIQHALLRTWQKYVAYAEQRPVAQTDYDQAGTLDHALEWHADEALKTVPRELAAKVFQALTDTDARRRRVRRPATVRELQSLTQASIADIAQCLDAFVADQRDFLTLSGPAADPETLVSITHESLIRRWTVLRDWVDEERSRKELFLSLAERARRYHVGNAARLTGPDLTLAEKWYREAKPTPEWVARYRGAADLATVVAYIAKSRGRARVQFSAIAGLIAAIVGVTAMSAVTYAQGEANALEQTKAANKARDIAVNALRKFRDMAKLSAAARSNDDVTALLVREVSEDGRRASLAAWSETASKALAWSAWQRFRPDAPAQIVAASPVDSQIAVAQADHNIAIWDTAPNPPVRVALLEWPPKVYTSNHIRYAGVRFSQDGKRVGAVDSFQNYVVWPAAGGEPRAVNLPDKTYFEASAAISPDLSRIGWTNDGRLNLWAPDEGKFAIHNLVGRFRSPAFDDTGTWLAAATAHGYGVWGAHDGVARNEIQLADLNVRDAGLALRSTSPEVALMAGGAVLTTLDGKVVLETEHAGEEPRFSPDGTALAYNSNWGTLLFPLAAPTELPSVLGPSVKSPAFAGGRIIGIGSDASVEIRATKPVGRSRVFLRSTVGLATFGGGKLLAAADAWGSPLITLGSGTKRLWQQLSADNRNRRTHSIAIDSAGERIAVGVTTYPRIFRAPSYNSLELWDAGAHKLSSRNVELTPNRPLAVSRAGRIAVSDYASVRLFSVAADSPTELRMDGRPGAIAFDIRDRLLAVQLNGGLKLWNVDDLAKLPQLLSGNGAAVALSDADGAVAFSNDSSLVASGTADGVIRIWNLGGGEHRDEPLLVNRDEPLLLNSHRGPITALAFNADATRLVSASRDQTARVWELPKALSKSSHVGQPLVLAGHRAAVRAATFAGDQVLTLAEDGILTEWPSTSEALEQALWETSRQCLDPDGRVAQLDETSGDAKAAYQECLKRVPGAPELPH